MHGTTCTRKVQTSKHTCEYVNIIETTTKGNGHLIKEQYAVPTLPLFSVTSYTRCHEYDNKINDCAFMYTIYMHKIALHCLAVVHYIIMM